MNSNAYIDYKEAMDYLADYLPTNNVLALVIASVIFVVTVALVAKKLISFLITVVLLFFAIASGMAIANNDLVRDFLKQKTGGETREITVVKEKEPEPAPETAPDKSMGETVDQIRDELVKLLNRLTDLLKTHEAEKPKKSD